MIAIFDYKENKVVIIGDKTYRVSIEEFNKIKNQLDAIGLTIINQQNSFEESTGAQINKNKNTLKSKNAYIASNGGRSVIVNGIEPAIQFLGIDDIKLMSEIVSRYNGIPDVINSLIKSGILVLIDEQEKNERIQAVKSKKKIKGSKIKQSSSLRDSVRDNGMFDSEDSVEDREDSVEDRAFKNAVKIDLDLGLNPAPDPN